MLRASGAKKPHGDTISRTSVLPSVLSVSLQLCTEVLPLPASSGPVDDLTRHAGQKQTFHLRLDHTEKPVTFTPNDACVIGQQVADAYQQASFIVAELTCSCACVCILTEILLLRVRGRVIFTQDFV